MTSTTDALRASVDLPLASQNVAVARRIVHQLLVGWSAELFIDDALLLLSELVSNVLRHVAGRAPMRVELTLAGPVLRVAVLDHSTAPPVQRDATASGGYGLQLIAALSKTWGSHTHPDGKRVWFELSRT
jgi:two-component sensor histidine kinase